MKKVLSILLVVVLAFAALPLVANAAGDPTFTLTNASGKAGDEVTVNLEIANNPGITALELKVAYSKTDLQLVSVENGTTFVDGDWNFNELNATGLAKNPFTIYFDNDVEDSNANGVVAVMKFKILDGAKTSTITASQETVYNMADDEIDFTYKPATVTVAAAPTAQEIFEQAVAADVAKAADDTFGNAASFKGLEMLGIQEKTDASDIRFVTAVSKDVLTDENVKDYGYVVTKSSKSKADAEAALPNLTPAIAKYSCKGTTCAAAGAYGDGSKDYSYVTFGVNNIPSGKCVLARFYVETTFGTTYYYATYGTAAGIVYTVA